MKNNGFDDGSGEEENSMNEKEKIESCYRQMYQGMIGKDQYILSEVLDDSFVLIHMTGMRQKKAAFIRAVEDGTLNYYSADHQRMDVVLHDGQADMVGQSVVGAAVFGGGRNTWRLQLRLKLIKKENEWKITEAKASAY